MEDQQRHQPGDGERDLRHARDGTRPADRMERDAADRTSPTARRPGSGAGRGSCAPGCRVHSLDRLRGTPRHAPVLHPARGCDSLGSASSSPPGLPRGCSRSRSLAPLPTGFPDPLMVAGLLVAASSGRRDGHLDRSGGVRQASGRCPASGPRCTTPGRAAISRTPPRPIGAARSSGSTTRPRWAASCSGPRSAGSGRRSSAASSSCWRSPA